MGEPAFVVHFSDLTDHYQTLAKSTKIDQLQMSESYELKEFLSSIRELLKSVMSSSILKEIKSCAKQALSYTNQIQTLSDDYKDIRSI